MPYPVLARIGLTGAEQPLNVLPLTPQILDFMSNYAGSNHILEMGRHFYDYVVSAAALPAFPPCLGLPHAYPFLALSNKLRAAGVTGNIGEGVCGVVADSTFRMPMGTFLHVKLKPSAGLRKTPDYLFRLSPYLPGPFQGIWPANLPHIPTWWPVESKARTTQAAVDSAVRREALPQLASFWYLINNVFPGAVGFGMTVAFAYEQQPRVLLNLFLPSNPGGLRNYLSSHATYDELRGSIVDSPDLIESYLHGC